MATSYVPGEWSFQCDLCGKRENSGNGVRTWDNFYVCAHHQEMRNPQDFVRGVRENQSLPWSRPVPPDTFVVSNFRLLQETGFAILQEVNSFGETSYILVN